MCIGERTRRSHFSVARITEFGDHLLLVRISFAVTHCLPSSFTDVHFAWLRSVFPVH